MDEEETQEHPEQEVHPAVQLLLARMDSHPEEFKSGGTWHRYFEPYKGYWNATEKKLFKAKQREIHMQAMHEEVMKKLFGGPKQDLNEGVLESVTRNIKKNAVYISQLQATQQQANAAMLNAFNTNTYTFPTDPIPQKPGLLGTLKGLIK